ncbi:MAG: HAD family phosphatase [Bacillota bacterium]|nr:HAD family phosphatase [Bacillota bacterium]
MLKAVIFDMDGVIVDSEPIHFEVDKRVMKKCGFIASDDILNPYVGVSNPEMWKDLKEKYNLILSVEELLKLQSELKIEVLNETKIEAIDGIIELLSDLRRNKIILAVASSSPRLFIETILETIKIREYFNAILSGEEVQRGKPYPDIFLKTAEMLKVNPHECIVIEDSTNGVKAALSAGMKCIGYANLNSGSQDLSRASTIVDSICEINHHFMISIM